MSLTEEERSFIPVIEETQVFDEEEIEQALLQFKSIATPDGRIDKAGFLKVLPLLFEDPEAERAQVIIQNQYFLERCFGVMDEEGDGLLTMKQFAEGIVWMFSSDPSDQIKFRWKLFDVDGDGFVSPQDIFVVVQSVMLAMVRAIKQEKKASEDEENAVWFEAAEAQVQAELGQSKLQHIINKYFAKADTDKSGTLDYAQFERAFLNDDDCFDWNELASEALEAIEAEFQGA
ncbi:NADPH oxidase 5 [Balamuthia mandrillaris]